jgi:UDP-GlcNAc3NAcA epimerase
MKRTPFNGLRKWGERQKTIALDQLKSLEMKILTVVGARPQFIKASAVSRAVGEQDDINEVLVHTGQHYDPNMSEVFFDELAIPAPLYHLGVGSGSHAVQTGQMLAALEPVLLHEQPDVVLVYGDTNSTLAGALAAAKLGFDVAHVEAGLRSFNRAMPEEINRVMVDHLAHYLFAPTAVAEGHLLREGCPRESIHVVGDVMFDAALFFRDRADMHVIERYSLRPDGFILATIHRAENTSDPERLHTIFNALAEVAEQMPVLLPLHPRTASVLERLDSDVARHPDLRIVPPLTYLEMIAAESCARLIVTDSGGVQKEAFFYGVPCVTLRTETEWTELVDLGWNTLIAPEQNAAMCAQILARLDAPVPSSLARPYGDGNAASQVLSLLRGRLPTAPR